MSHSLAGVVVPQLPQEIRLPRPDLSSVRSEKSEFDQFALDAAVREEKESLHTGTVSPTLGVGFELLSSPKLGLLGSTLMIG